MKRSFFTYFGLIAKKHVALFAIIALVAIPGSVFCQEQQQEEQQQQIEQPAQQIDRNPVDVNSGTLNTSPWPSNANSATDNNSSSSSIDRYSNTGAAARPVTGTSGTAQRPVGGGTVTAGGPGGGGGFGGGNPDVPFDDNMNLAFFMVGLVFAFVIYKKQLAVKYK